MNDESEDIKKPQETLGTDAAGVADTSMAASSAIAEQDATVKQQAQAQESAVGTDAQTPAIDDSSYNPYDEIVAAVDDTEVAAIEAKTNEADAGRVWGWMWM